MDVIIYSSLLDIFSIDTSYTEFSPRAALLENVFKPYVDKVEMCNATSVRGVKSVIRRRKIVPIKEMDYTLFTQAEQFILARMWNPLSIQGFKQITKNMLMLCFVEYIKRVTLLGLPENTPLKIKTFDRNILTKSMFETFRNDYVRDGRMVKINNATWSLSTPKYYFSV